jgi:hypothetical protein
MRFGASDSEVGSHHQEQNSEGGKAQNGQYTAYWARLLQIAQLPPVYVVSSFKIISSKLNVSPNKSSIVQHISNQEDA